MCAGEGCFRYSRSRNRTAGWGSYLYRWPDFVGNLSALYPDIRGSLLMRFDRSRCFDAVFSFSRRLYWDHGRVDARLESRPQVVRRARVPNTPCAIVFSFQTMLRLIVGRT